MKTASRRRRAAEPTQTTTTPGVVDGGAEAARSLDRIVHQPVRLAIVSALAVNDGLTFSELKTLLDASDGNLSVHTRKLEDAGYVIADKGFVGRVPRTVYTLTAEGRKALQRYVSHMESLIGAVRGSEG